jgi:tripartite-type tricarboxylate transporter receptor subunit TctC
MDHSPYLNKKLKPKMLLKFSKRYAFFSVIFFSSLVAGNCFADYPEKPIKMIVPYVSGGVSDVLGRLFAAKITDLTGKPIVVENKVGATGRIGYEFGAKANPDGYTVTSTDASLTMMPGMYNKLNFDITDLKAVALIADMPFVIVVNNPSKISSLADLIAQAKQEPKKLNFGSSGMGGVNHLVTEMFMANTGVEFSHIPYKGMGDAVIGLLSNQVDLIVTALPTGINFVKTGKMKGLAISSVKRVSSLSETPTASELGIPFVANNWIGVTMPKNSPREAFLWWQKNMSMVMSQPETKQKIISLGAEPNFLVGEDFGKMISSDTQRWTEVIRGTNIKME